MTGNDKAMRAFVRGALKYGSLGIGLALFYDFLVVTFTDFNVPRLPYRFESFLWVAPWFLAGGILGVLERFYREGQFQFSIRLLLLIMIVISFTGAWGVLARSRFQEELHAEVVLREEFDALGFASQGFFFPTYTSIYLGSDIIDSGRVPRLVQQLSRLSGLYWVEVSEKTLSEDDLKVLRERFPDIEFVRE